MRKLSLYAARPALLAAGLALAYTRDAGWSEEDRAPLAAIRDLREGRTGQDVATVEESLSRAGYDPGEVDDTFDEDYDPLQHSGARLLGGADITWVADYND